MRKKDDRCASRNVLRRNKIRHSFKQNMKIGFLASGSNTERSDFKVVCVNLPGRLLEFFWTEIANFYRRESCLLVCMPYFRQSWDPGTGAWLSQDGAEQHGPAVLSAR